MTQHLSPTALAQMADLADPPVRTQVDRSFGLPTRLYGWTVALYLGFLALMSVSFMNAELAIPMAIFVGFIVIAFGLAGKWVTMAPANPTAQPDWHRFRRDGIQTASGVLTARQASVQVLLLPALILFWGICVVAIRAAI